MRNQLKRRVVLYTTSCDTSRTCIFNMHFQLVSHAVHIADNACGCIERHARPTENVCRSMPRNIKPAANPYRCAERHAISERHATSALCCRSTIWKGMSFYRTTCEISWSIFCWSPCLQQFRVKLVIRLRGFLRASRRWRRRSENPTRAWAPPRGKTILALRRNIFNWECMSFCRATSWKTSIERHAKPAGHAFSTCIFSRFLMQFIELIMLVVVENDMQDQLRMRSVL